MKFRAILLFFCGQLAIQAAEPAIFWSSSPVRPGEAVVVIGEGFGTKPMVEITRLPDDTKGALAEPAWPGKGSNAVVLDAGNQGFKVVVPPTFQPGLFMYRVSVGGRTTTTVLNRPEVWWTQGDQGRHASPGGWVRVFGRNLGATGKTRLRLEGPRAIDATASAADDFAARLELPRDLPAGEYRLRVHNGYGGAVGFSAAAAVRVEKTATWPQAVFNAREFGAEGDGRRDDTEALNRALQKAGASGGGVVLLPRGRYRVSDTLFIPRFTVLRGESASFSCLAWAAMPKAPKALVQGTNSFGIEDLTIYALDHQHVIVGDLGDKPDAGNVFLRRVRVRADLYRGHPTEAEVDERFRASLKLSTGGGDTVRLGGENVEITDCDFYGSGRPLYLSRVRGGRVSGTRFFNGRWGWYCISGSDGLIFENNEITGADLMSTGGGLNCLDGSAFSQNIYYARNRLSLMHGWDREAMTSDAGGEAYFGKVTRAEGTRLTLAESPKWMKRDYKGAAVFVLGGKGAGQVRRLTRHNGAEIEVDRPWEVAPDAASDVSITMFQGRYVLVGNQFTDTGAMQFYGTSIECVIAGNRGSRMQGFRDLGLWYHGYQPSWFCQLLDNEITEGNYFHWNSAADAWLDITGATHAPFTGSLNLGAVARRNRLDGQSFIHVSGAVRDALVESNHVAHAAQGVFVSRTTERVTLRGNSFEDVAQQVSDENAEQRAAEAKLARFMNRKEPVAVWSFDQQTGERFTDTSGNGFSAAPNQPVPVAPDGVRGKAARFTGSNYLQVAEAAVFNAPEISVSLWVKPDTLRGRRGFISKRFAGTGAPWVLSQNDANITFEAATPDGKWPWNFHTGAALKTNVWTHVAFVARRGRVDLFINGKPAASKEVNDARLSNWEPVTIGREAWGGDPAKSTTPGPYLGLLDEVKIWTRALSAEEVLAEFQSEPARSP